MQFRFRYLRPDGREVQVETIDDLRDLLRNGDVAHDTLLYDALTSEWAPLRAHAVTRLLEDVGDVPPPDAPPPEAADEEPSVADAPASATDLDELALDLDPALDEASTSRTEDTVRDLLRERKREGESASTDRSAFTTAGEWGMVVDAGLDEPDSPASGETPDRPARRTGVQGGGVPPRGPTASEPSRPVAEETPPPLRSRPQVPLTSPGRSRRWRSAPALIAVGSAGLLGMLVYAVAWSDDRPDPPADVASPVPVAPRPLPDATPAVSVVGGSEAVALGDMVEALDSLRRARGLGDVPGDWLEGIYLSNASRYPEVRGYWERYARFVDDVRQRDTALFRQSFVRRLEGEGAGTAVVSMRLARAIRLFEGSQPARDTVYDAMAQLAGASLDLHDLLVEREADIEYDPVLPDRVSRDPVVEAVTDDPLLRDRIWVELDRIFHSLSVLSGGDVGTRDALGEGSLDGIRAPGGS
ncbi:MAG: hypothetical protein KY453_06190 [Gemmatimonadetes bacterium]|nr:hypothetical protein [Gemmatimonadota bacterium]